MNNIIEQHNSFIQSVIERYSDLPKGGTVFAGLNRAKYLNQFTAEYTKVTGDEANRLMAANPGIEGLSEALFSANKEGYLRWMREVYNA